MQDIVAAIGKVLLSPTGNCLAGQTHGVSSSGMSHPEEMAMTRRSCDPDPLVGRLYHY